MPAKEMPWLVKWGFTKSYQDLQLPQLPRIIRELIKQPLHSVGGNPDIAPQKDGSNGRSVVGLRLRFSPDLWRA